jgi:hypothetical protein
MKEIITFLNFEKKEKFNKNHPYYHNSLRGFLSAFSVHFFFKRGISLCSPGWPPTPSSPASNSQVLGL